MAKQSVYADGEQVKAIQAVARKQEVTVSIGISEKVRYSSVTMFNANLIIGVTGEILVHHRKLVPTFYEKLAWTLEMAKDLKWRTYLSRVQTERSMSRLGVNIYISSWPSKSIMRVITGEGADVKTTGSKFGRWDPVHMNRLRAGSACVEGKCFGVISSAFMSSENVESLVSLAPDHARQTMRLTLDNADQAETTFLDPSGLVIGGFTIDKATRARKDTEALRNEEGILYADLDMGAIIEGKQYHAHRHVSKVRCFHFGGQHREKMPGQVPWPLIQVTSFQQLTITTKYCWLIIEYMRSSSLTEEPFIDRAMVKSPCRCELLRRWTEQTPPFLVLPRDPDIED
ncbi:uncharacterized protein A1O9_12070 [Exophiala aquamarina CBS 119918]|uniref:CN hydrolase domain-containing protein n=1 Tax=Exophiala aquamarina CBS 119918 TaxID=1182545 RepID=A0A072NXI0_9EURO|nr:uncharacterized protein A1O9_12070 [Exophiala aquamarina CBS 119918]KEF51733.1 hypothetical protein A1O9_12070 [Exophiala aquamarina CBS 119918]